MWELPHPIPLPLPGQMEREMKRDEVLFDIPFGITVLLIIDLFQLQCLNCGEETKAWVYICLLVGTLAALIYTHTLCWSGIYPVLIIKVDLMPFD